MMFRFAYLAILFLLVPVAGWIIFSMQRSLPSITYSAASRLAQIAGSGGLLMARLPIILRSACLILLVLAAATNP